MKEASGFPYPYIVKAMDEHYSVKVPVKKKKKVKREIYTKKKMKVVPKKKLSILITTFWDYPHTGGLSNYIKTLSEGLEKLGHHVDVVSPNQFPINEVNTVRDEIIPTLRSFFYERYGSCNSKILKNHRHLYVYERMLIKYMDLKKYDVFHAQDLFTANILGRINEYYEKPLFFTNHGMFTSNRVKFGMFQQDSVEEVYYKALEKKAIEFADHLIILNNLFRQPLMQLGAEQTDMTTVLTGIDYPYTNQMKNKMAKELVITCVARLGPRKGHNVLFNALSQLPKSCTDNIKVLIVGDGEMRATLEQQVRSLKLSMVEFLGTRDDIPNILSQTDIFVLPTLNDSLPISIIEAMHSESCVISTTAGGIPELVTHAKTGFLVEPGDTNQLAQALKAAIINKEAREKLAKNAKQFAKEHLTRDAMIGQIESIYRKYVRGGDSYGS